MLGVLFEGPQFNAKGELVVENIPTQQKISAYPLLMAGSVLSTLPMLIMFIILQKHLIAGISLSGVRK